jgi:hypothetical protein
VNARGADSGIPKLDVSRFCQDFDVGGQWPASATCRILSFLNCSYIQTTAKHALRVGLCPKQSSSPSGSERTGIGKYSEPMLGTVKQKRSGQNFGRPNRPRPPRVHLAIPEAHKAFIDSLTAQAITWSETTRLLEYQFLHAGRGRICSVLGLMR